MERELISDPVALRPDTPWDATKWARVPEESLVSHAARPRLCVATLLPFANGLLDWAGFVRCIAWMRDAAARMARRLGIPGFAPQAP